MSKQSKETRWKEEYRQLLAEMDDKERAWRRVESLLRQSISRVSIAAGDVDDRLQAPLQDIRGAVVKTLDERRLEAGLEGLDRALKHMETRPRTDATGGEQGLTRVDLDAGLLAFARALPIDADDQSQLTDAVSASTRKNLRQTLKVLGEQVAALLTADSLDGGVDALSIDDRVEPVLLNLIDQVETVAGPSRATVQLRGVLTGGVSDAKWHDVLNATAEVVVGALGSLQSQRIELAKLFEHVSAQLGYFQAYVESSRTDASSSRANRRALESDVSGGMAGIRDALSDDADIRVIRTHIQGRLDDISHVITRFREDEESRLESTEEQNEALTRRIAELEAKTTALQERCATQRDQLELDALTQVHSRFAYDLRVREEHLRWQRHGGALAFALWDVDHFKQINDRYGHQAGDRALHRLAQFVRSQLRQTDFLARIGGEEFVVMLPNTDCQDALEVMNAAREKVGDAGFNYRGERVQVTVSCGVTEFSPGDSPETVYARADRALYQAKSGGRNRCVGV